MFDKKIRGIPLLGIVIGAIAFWLFIGGTTLSGWLAYSNAVAASASNAEMLRRDLDSQITTQEQNLAVLRTALNGSTEKSDQHERSITTLRNDADKLTKQIAALEMDRSRLQAQVLIAKASGKISRAIIHLNADNSGLAKRDLATGIDALDLTRTMAGEDKRNTLAEISVSLAELRSSIDAKAYPIATLEILGDKIDDLVGKW